MEFLSLLVISPFFYPGPSSYLICICDSCKINGHIYTIQLSYDQSHACFNIRNTVQVILFEIDCAILYRKLHELCCQFISWTNWWNTVVLGRMYRSILSSCLGIDAQYWLTSGAKRRRRPVLPLNSEAWWQYWPIHPTQNYCILIVSMPTFVPNIVIFQF